MAITDKVIGTEFGPEFDLGTIQANKIRLKLGPNMAIALDGTIDVNLTLGVGTTTIYHERYAGRSLNGTTSSFVREATMTRTAVGRWEVRFTTAHPDGANYTPSFSWEEGAARDNPKLGIVQGTQNANGFDVMITVDDNGGAADVYSDQPWTFGVEAPIDVVTAVTLT